MKPGLQFICVCVMCLKSRLKYLVFTSFKIARTVLAQRTPTGTPPFSICYYTVQQTQPKHLLRLKLSSTSFPLFGIEQDEGGGGGAAAGSFEWKKCRVQCSKEKFLSSLPQFELARLSVSLIYKKKVQKPFCTAHSHRCRAAPMASCHNAINPGYKMQFLILNVYLKKNIFHFICLVAGKKLISQL